MDGHDFKIVHNRFINKQLASSMNTNGFEMGTSPGLQKCSVEYVRQYLCKPVA